MKFNKKVIALLLAVSIILSVVIPISLTSGSAVTGTGIKATYYKATKNYFAFLSGSENLDANFTSESQQFAATYQKMMDSSGLIEKTTGVKNLKAANDKDKGDYYIIKWEGTMTAKTSGTYTLVGRKIDNGFVMLFGEQKQKVYEYWGIDYFDRERDGVPEAWLPSDQGSFTVIAGQSYPVEIYFLEVFGGKALDIVATTNPNDTASGSDINDAFTFDLTEEIYRSISTDGDNSLAINNFIGPDLGRDRNGATCIPENQRYTASFNRLINAMNQTDIKTVSSFSAALINEDRYVIVYEGTLVPQETGSYTFGTYDIDNGFYMEIKNDEGTMQPVYEMWAGGTWNDNSTTTYTSSISLKAGQTYSFKAAFLETNGGQVLELNATLNGKTAPISSYFTFYEDTTSDLSFNLRAVNAMGGETTITNQTELTIQYTDATLGEGIKMYAKITDTNENVLVERQPIENATLQPVLETVYGAKEEINIWAGRTDANEGDTATRTSYANTAGAVTFKPALKDSESYAASDLEITVWIEGGVYNKSSNMATTTINNGFIASGTPTTDDFGPTNWMDYIDGSTLLSQINMPGTHDSASKNFTDTAGGLNPCQDATIAEQLKYGVRYFDIRASKKEALKTDVKINGEDVKSFYLCHANYTAYTENNAAKLSFYDVYLDMKNFLTYNPSETIIIAVSDDGDDGVTKREDIISSIASFVKADPNMWYTKTTEIPTLDDVRGKIVFFRRITTDYVSSDLSGMDFFWIGQSNGRKHAIVPESSSNAVTTYYVQDAFQQVIGDRWDSFEKFIDETPSTKKANEYYLHFLSGTGGTVFGTGEPPKNVANGTSGWLGYDGMNERFNSKYSTAMPKSAFGYVVFDYITAALAQKVYLSNTFTKEAQVGNADTNKVIVHYDFADVVDGKVVDAAKNGFDGTLENTNALIPNSIYDIITFDNANNRGTDAGHIEIPQTVFRGTGNTATVQMWMKDTSSTETVTSLFETGMDQKNSFTAITKLGSNGARYAISAQKGGADLGDNAANPTIQSLDKWHLVTFVMNNDQIDVYVDDTLVNDNGTTPTNFSDLDTGIFTDTSVLLGATRLWGDQGFTGAMGDFTIYNYAVNGSEVATTYKELAYEYTYILEASLGSSVAIAREDNDVNSYIDEQYEDEGSTIYLTVDSSYDLTNAPLNLSYDGSKVEIYNNGVSQGKYEPGAGTLYDLSGEVTLKVTSLDGLREKWYDVEIIKDEEPSPLVLHYDFENIGKNGVVKDISGNGLDGKVNSVGATVNNSSVSLDGIDGHVKVNSNAIVGTGEDFTISMFVKPDAFNVRATTTLISYGSNEDNRLVVLATFDKSQSPRWNIKANGVENCMEKDGIVLVPGEWTQVTFVQDSGTLKLYMNNELISTSDVTVLPSEIGVTNFWLGDATTNVYAGDPGFNGEFADFRIYTTALTDEEVFDLYKENYEDNEVTLNASKIQLESFYDWNKDEKGETDDVNTQLKLEYKPQTGTNQLAGTKGGGIFYYKNVNFGTGMNQATITFFGSTGVVSTGTQVTLYVDSISDSNRIGTIALDPVNGDSNWDTEQTATASLNQLVIGTHDLYYVITGNDDKMSLATHDDLAFSYVEKVGITVKDYNTEEVIGAYYPENGTKVLADVEKDGYIIVDWYNSTKTSPITTARNGDTVYLQSIAVEAPIIVPDASKSIRATDNGKTNGLRFKATITRGEFYNYFNNGNDYTYSEDANFKFGIVLLPVDYLEYKGIDPQDLDLTCDPAVVNVIGKKVYNPSNEDGNLDYTAVILNIPEAQYERDFVARAYIEYTDKEGRDPKVVYSDEISVGSYLDVAKKAYADAVAKSDTDTINKLLGIFSEAELTQ